MSTEEIEVKISVEELGYRKLIEYFESAITDTYYQWNVFFDTHKFDLRKSRRVLRIRSIRSQVSPLSSSSSSSTHQGGGIGCSSTTKWYITVKRPGIFRNGIAVRPESEYEIEAELAQELLAHPADIMKNVPKTIRKTLRDCSDWKFEIIGDFKTTRREFTYENLNVQADETTLPNMQSFYELEIENDDPTTAKQKMEMKLKEIHVPFVNSSVSKLGQLMRINESQRCSRVFSKQ